MASRARRQRYDLIHVHNIPDFLVFAAWYPKLTGSKVILDIHDIVPEFFESKFSVSDRSLLVRALRLVEKISAAFADHVILSNHVPELSNIINSIGLSPCIDLCISCWRTHILFSATQVCTYKTNCYLSRRAAQTSRAWYCRARNCHASEPTSRNWIPHIRRW